LVLHKYTNAKGEVADFNIIFHMSYENALKRSIAIVEAFKPTGELQLQAQIEVLASYQESLHKVQTIPIDTVDDGYHHYRDDDGKLIQGVKLHEESETLHLYGLIHLKRVIVPIVYPKVNSRPLTIEKNKLRKLCPVSRFRQFKLQPNQLEKIVVQKLTLLPPEEAVELE
jgi:hypothetical protein